MSRILVVIIFAITLVGCNWVQLTPAGQNVQLSNDEAVESCQRVGRTQAETLDKIVLVERGGNKLQQELVTLARNEAGDLGGNRIVPESVIIGGSQSFGVYRC